LSRRIIAVEECDATGVDILTALTTKNSPQKFLS